MKKFKNYIFLLLLISIFTVSCSNKSNEKNDKDIKEKKIVYTTFFPVYDLTNMIVGDKVELRSIMKPSDEPHSFELKINDMKDLKNADLIIFNGANMETFIRDLKNAVNNEDKFLDLSQGLTLLSGKNSENPKESVNPHTWLSIKNAIIQLDTIYKKLSSIDPQNESFYKENLEKAQNEMKKLDEKFEKTLADSVKKDRYFVVSHAAFNYLAKDYNLKQVAVTGISPDEEPSAKQLKDIADFVKKNNISTIFFEGKATPKVAQTLATNTNTKTSTLYTMESLTEEEMKMGYLKLMEFNLEKLVESFGE